MNDYASLENCKRLYELSGWVITDFYWPVGEGMIPVPTYTSYPEKINYTKYSIPAYSAGYLLRKLPGYVGDEFLDICWYGDGWECAYQKSRRGLWNAQIGSHHADTPENSLALLAIKLFEDGILIKGQE